MRELGREYKVAHTTILRIVQGASYKRPVGADSAHKSHGICPKCMEEKFPEKVTA